MFWQNDDAGKDQVKGLRDGLGDKADKMIIADKSYEVSDPSIDSQIVALRDSGADIVLLMGGAEGIGAGDPESRRDRMEAEILPRQRLDLGRRRAEARRL